MMHTLHLHLGGEPIEPHLHSHLKLLNPVWLWIRSQSTLRGNDELFVRCNFRRFPNLSINNIWANTRTTPQYTGSHTNGGQRTSVFRIISKGQSLWYSPRAKFDMGSITRRRRRLLKTWSNQCRGLRRPEKTFAKECGLLQVLGTASSYSRNFTKTTPICDIQASLELTMTKKEHTFEKHLTKKRLHELTNCHKNAG